MAVDPEDGMDQVMVSAWNGIAQQLRTLQNELRTDHVRRVDRRMREEVDAKREDMQRRRELLSLKTWETENRARLNNGFEATLRATVLAGGDTWRTMNDRALLQTWMVAQQLEGNDPGFTRELVTAQQRLKDEWAHRHPDQKIDAAADRLMNHITITYAQTSPELTETIDAFAKAGVPVTQQSMDRTEFEKLHAGQPFWVDSQLTDSWGGYDHDRIVEAVMVSPVDSNDVMTRIAFLKEQGLPESSHAANTATGAEPSSVSETVRSENSDNAPIRTDPPATHTDSKPDGTMSSSVPAVSAATGTTLPVNDGEELDSGATSGYEDMPIGLNEPEDWYGPDPFGEYSPAMETAIAAGTPPVTAPAMPSTIPQETLAAVNTTSGR